MDAVYVAADLMSTELAALVGESYERAYTDMVRQVQHWGVQSNMLLLLFHVINMLLLFRLHVSGLSETKITLSCSSFYLWQLVVRPGRVAAVNAVGCALACCWCLVPVSPACCGLPHLLHTSTQ
jgi:hypothetical protein